MPASRSFSVTGWTSRAGTLRIFASVFSSPVERGDIRLERQGRGGLPLPRNVGDWMALLSGMVWAYGSMRVRVAGSWKVSLVRRSREVMRSRSCAIMRVTRGPELLKIVKCGVSMRTHARRSVGSGIGPGLIGCPCNRSVRTTSCGTPTP